MMPREEAVDEREHITTGLDCWCGPVLDHYGADDEREGPDG